MDNLQPWVRGPFELLCEAQVNLERDSEVGRRSALIVFDDAIEVCISTYLGLRPIQRNGKTYQKEQTEKWLRNFHTRLDFVEAEITDRNLEWEVDRRTIIWSHDYRNDQYDGGRKGIPDQHVLIDARRAALWIFIPIAGRSRSRGCVGERRRCSRRRASSCA